MHGRRTWALVALATLALGLSPAAVGAERPTRGGVLFVSSDGLSSDLAADLSEVLAASLERDRRAEILPKERFRLFLTQQGGPSAQACAMDAGCLRRAGRAAGLDFVVVGTATKQDAGFRLRLTRYSMPLDITRALTYDLDAGLVHLAETLEGARDELLRPDGALLTIECSLAGAQVTVDGVTLGATPIASREIVPGEHEIVVRAAGYTTEKRRVACPPAAACPVRFMMRPEVADPRPPETPPIEEPAVPPPIVRRDATSGAGLSGQRIAAWTTLAGALAAGATGTVFAVRTMRLEDDLDSACDEGVCRLTEAEARSRRDDGRTSAILTNVFFGVAGAAAVTSLVLFLTEPDREPAVTVTPTAGTGELGLGATVRF